MGAGNDLAHAAVNHDVDGLHHPGQDHAKERRERRRNYSDEL
jgi:hypothetical protein